MGFYLRVKIALSFSIYLQIIDLSIKAVTERQF